MTALLEAKELRVGYGARTVVDDVSLSLTAGRSLAIVGPNAAGKSTLLRALCGAHPLTAGTILIGGVPLEGMKGAERARRLALVPQSSRLDLDFSVREMVAFGRTVRVGGWGTSTETDRQAIARALAAADVAHLADRAFSLLSGGERQRVLLARALAQEAPVLLLDEPTAHLDLGHQLLVVDTVRAHAQGGGAALVVLHDLALAARLDEVAVLHEGRLVAVGPGLEVLTPERLRAVWGVAGRLEPHPSGPALVLDRRA